MFKSMINYLIYSNLKHIDMCLSLAVYVAGTCGLFVSTGKESYIVKALNAYISIHIYTDHLFFNDLNLFSCILTSGLIRCDVCFLST